MQNSKEQFFEAIYRQHFKEVQIHAYRYTGNWDRAQAAAQEAFFIACKRIDVFASSENPLGWLKNAAKNAALNAERKRAAQIKLLSKIGGLAEEAYTPDLLASEKNLIEEYSAYASKEEVTLLKRIAVDGEAYADVAADLGISMWACRKRVERIAARIREQLEKEN